MLRILALEPYYGGSHKAFLDGYRRHSRHALELLTLPAHKWKWRMRAGALTFAEELRLRPGEFDVVFASDYLDLAAFASICPRPVARLPRVVYFHENQLTYPVQHEDERDYQFGFTNITTCLAADRVLFNSRFHLKDFADGAARLLRKTPGRAPDWAPARVRERSEVVPVGVDLASIDAARGGADARGGPLTVLWNHRWEYDKGVDDFFELMMEVQAEGREFELVVTGQSFRETPPVVEKARRRLAPCTRAFGYVEGRDDYCKLLLESDVVVSTAKQEFFGISVVEAVYAGCTPLLPDGLSYPELLPPDAHADCLYAGRDELKERLVRLMACPAEARTRDLGPAMARFGWDAVAPLLDDVMEDVCGG